MRLRIQGLFRRALKPLEKQERQAIDLEEINLASAATNDIELRAIASFRRWLHDLGIQTPLEVFVMVPTLLSVLVNRFGSDVYKQGFPRGLFVFLLNALKKERAGLHIHLVPAWRLVTKWQLVEPTKHRVPLPEALYKAMVVISILQGRFRFAGCMIVGFLAKMRPSELCSGQRRDLILPEDVLEEESEAAYLRVGMPKSRWSGPKVQHGKVLGKLEVHTLFCIFGSLGQDEVLFPGTMGMFRSRWDLALNLIGVEKSLQVTPGGIRGGALYQV